MANNKMIEVKLSVEDYNQLHGVGVDGFRDEQDGLILLKRKDINFVLYHVMKIMS